MRRAFIVLQAMAMMSCFNKGLLAGLPCNEDAECGDYQCVNGVCNGTPGPADDTSTSANDDGSDESDHTEESASGANTAPTLDIPDFVEQEVDQDTYRDEYVDLRLYEHWKRDWWRFGRQWNPARSWRRRRVRNRTCAGTRTQWSSR